MNELLFSCTEDLTQATSPACGTDFGDRVVAVMLAKTNLWDDVPTPLDINEAWSDGDLTVITHITNGHRVFVGSQEIEVVYKEQVDKLYRVEGRIRRITPEIARMTERLNRYPSLYVWYITNKNYCFGGYQSTVDFTLMMQEGKGSPPYISFQFDFVDLGIDLADYDSGYENIPNVSDEYASILTEGEEYIITEDEQIIIEE